MAVYDNTEFDLARQRAQQQANAGVQQKRDVLARRQAQLGGGPGGAFIKAEQQAVEEGQQQLADVNEGINAAQRAENRRIAEIEAAQKYGTSEREAAQAFTAQQTAGQQAFQQKNMDLDRAFQEKQFAQQGKQWQSQFGEAKRQSGVAEKLAKSEYSQNIAQNRQNMILNAKKLGMTPDQMTKFLDDVGGGITVDENYNVTYGDAPDLGYLNEPAAPVAPRVVAGPNAGKKGRGMGGGGFVIDEAAVKRRQQRGGRY